MNRSAERHRCRPLARALGLLLFPLLSAPLLLAEAATPAPVAAPAAAAVAPTEGASVWPPLPQAATSFGATLAEGYVYLYGGNTGKAHEFNRECVRGDFFRLKLPGQETTATLAWEKLPGGLGLLSSAVVSHQGRVLRIGGMNARNEPGAKNDLRSTDEVMSYDPATGAWSALPPLPEPRSSHDAVVVGDTLWVGGGWRLSGGEENNTGQWTKTLLSLDLKQPAAGWKTQPQPFERRALAMAAQGGKLWFIGGMDEKGEPSRAVDWFDPATGQWGQGPEIPEGLMAGFGIAACSAGGQLYISPLSGKVSTLSPDGTHWREAAVLTPARFFHRLLPLADDRLLAVGGSNRKGHILTLEVIKPGAKTAATALEEAVSAPPAAAVPVPSSPATEAVVVPAPVKSAAAWPQWRGPERDGISPETGWRKDWPAAGPKLLWRAQVGAGLSSCVVAEGRVIVQGNDGEGHDGVCALDALTGAELWRQAFPVKSAAHEMPIVPNGPGATPTMVGGQVFVLSREGDLLCLAAADGQIIWRRNLLADLGGKRPVYGYTQSPLVAQGRVFLDLGSAPGETSSTAALSTADGTLLWRTGRGEAGYSSARLLERDGRSYLAMLKGEALDLYDPADGRLLWSFATTARDFANALTPVFVGHCLLVSNTGEPMARLLDWDLGTTPNVRALWSNQQFALLFNNPIALDGCLFAFNEKRRGRSEFTCLDATTGVSRWVSDAVPIGTFILADGHWLFLTRDGEVVLVPASAAELRPVARFQAVTGKCYATPALASGRLYVRSNAGEVAAFDLN